MVYLALIFFAACLTLSNAFIESGTISSSEMPTLMQLISNEQSMRLQLQKLQEQVQALTNNSAATKDNRYQVAFTGKIQHYEYFANRTSIIKVDYVSTNIGNAYNLTTGVFNCPVSGLYLFSVNIFADDAGDIFLKLFQNRLEIATIILDGGNVINSGSDTVVVHAEIGDNIFLNNMANDPNLHTIHVMSFTGVLLKAD